MSLRLRAADRAALAAGADALGVPLDSGALAALEAFAELLAVWSPKVNLISCTGPAALVERHLLDSLVAAPLPAPGARLVDLGSGAGLPGVPLAIARPEVQVTLVEPRRRRVSFLEEARRRIPLPNVTVLERRAEAQVDHQADVVACRAVWQAGTVVESARPWVRPGGTLALFCSVADARAVSAGDFTVVEIREYRIGSDRPRALVVLRAPA